MNKKIFRNFKLQNNLAFSLGLHLVGVLVLGFNVGAVSTSSSKETVMVVNLVSQPLIETQEIQISNSHLLVINNQENKSGKQTEIASLKPSLLPSRKTERPQDEETPSPETISSSIPQKPRKSNFDNHKSQKEIRVKETLEREKSIPQPLKVSKEGMIAPNPHLFPNRESQGTTYHIFSSYLKEIQSRLEKFKQYPWLARMKGQEGSTRLGFRITHLGEPREIHVLRSSGWKELDEESLNIVRRVGTFSTPPSNWKEDIQVEVPMVFQIE